ncbi:MAG TPA: Fe-only nitrogenase accessory protein AnfO [Clostridium sp.]|uniref:Fe-only nitrogenase accessory protein AnfO n=1 Tax=Clostridium sp. TaxID=1506 RepID=UPI002F954628
MEIAVFQDISGKTQSFLEPGIIKVYSGQMGEWKIIKEIIFRIDNIVGLKAIRESIKNMAEALGDCKIFVGREIKGIPYHVLDGMEFNTWEIEGTPKEFLEFVFKKEEEEAKSNTSAKTQNKLPQIEQFEDGNYFVNLKSIQENSVNITSKGILIPFLRITTFYQLKIICDHIPHWFVDEFDKLNLEMESEVINKNEFRVTVYPKGCKE